MCCGKTGPRTTLHKTMPRPYPNMFCWMLGKRTPRVLWKPRATRRELPTKYHHIYPVIHTHLYISLCFILSVFLTLQAEISPMKFNKNMKNTHSQHDAPWNRFWPPRSPVAVLLQPCCLPFAVLALLAHCCSPVASLLLPCCSPVAPLSLPCHFSVAVLPPSCRYPVASCRFLSFSCRHATFCLAPSCRSQFALLWFLHVALLLLFPVASSSPSCRLPVVFLLLPCCLPVASLLLACCPTWYPVALL